MSRSSQNAAGALARAGRGRLALTLVLATFLVVLTAALAGTGAMATSGTTVVLGGTSTMPDPSCPEDPCQAIGSVTGFQLSTDQSTLPFLVKRSGKVVRWSLSLSQPTSKQRSFFNGFFGTPPEAGLAILRRMPGTTPPRYELRRKGTVHVLSAYLGQTVEFGASLPVEPGDIVGLTIPTWAPAFAENLTPQNAWRASRMPGKCTNTTDVRQGEPQDRLNSRETYGCLYKTARLLYTATVREG